MVFSSKDLAIIENIIGHLQRERVVCLSYLEKPFSKNWHYSSVKGVVKKIRETGTTDRRPGSGRPPTAVTEENTDAVRDVILSQESDPGSHEPPSKIFPKLRIKGMFIQVYTIFIN